MNNLIRLTVLTFAIVAGSAFGQTTFHFPGTNCRPIDGAEEWGSWSFHSSTPADNRVICPITSWTGGNTITIDSVTLDYVDTNIYESLNCFFGVRSSGGVTNSGILYSCGTTGGCASDSAPSYTGSGYLQLPGSGPYSFVNSMYLICYPSKIKSYTITLH